jgi:hypothetical protein
MSLVLLWSAEYCANKCGSHFHNVQPGLCHDVHGANFNEITESSRKTSALQSFFIKYLTRTSIFETLSAGVVLCCAEFQNMKLYFEYTRLPATVIQRLPPLRNSLLDYI